MGKKFQIYVAAHPPAASRFIFAAERKTAGKPGILHICYAPHPGSAMPQR
jgi:hypothetical protein